MSKRFTYCIEHYQNFRGNFDHIYYLQAIKQAHQTSNSMLKSEVRVIYY